jgi:hypothetical protein
LNSEIVRRFLTSACSPNCNQTLNSGIQDFWRVYDLRIEVKHWIVTDNICNQCMIPEVAKHWVVAYKRFATLITMCQPILVASRCKAFIGIGRTNGCFRHEVLMQYKRMSLWRVVCIIIAYASYTQESYRVWAAQDTLRVLFNFINTALYNHLLNGW